MTENFIFHIHIHILTWTDTLNEVQKGDKNDYGDRGPYG